MKTRAYVLATLITCIVLSCNNESKEVMPTLPIETFRDGDIVFRRGMGIMSHIVLHAESEGVYSHTGILKKEGDKWYVIHAVPNESDFKGDIDRVKKDPICRFFAPDRAARGAVMRYTGPSTTAKKAANSAIEMNRRKTLFDHKYDLNDTTEMYCTELINFVYKKEGIDLSEGRISHVNLPAVGGTYLLPSDLTKSRHLITIYCFP